MLYIQFNELLHSEIMAITNLNLRILFIQNLNWKYLSANTNIIRLLDKINWDSLSLNKNAIECFYLTIKIFLHIKKYNVSLIL